MAIIIIIIIGKLKQKNMKNLKFTKMLMCLTLVLFLSIGIVSAKMFGHDCSYSIGPNESGECTITITKTSWYFWIPDRTIFGVPCDAGFTVSDLCGDTPYTPNVE